MNYPKVEKEDLKPNHYWYRDGIGGWSTVEVYRDRTVGFVLSDIEVSLNETGCNALDGEFRGPIPEPEDE